MTEKKMASVVQRFKVECEKRKKIEKKLKQRLIFEKTVSTVSSRFIAVKNINTAINQTLRDICRLSGASRAYIFFFSKDGKTMSNTHEWCRKGVSSQIKKLQDIPSNSLPWWVAQLRRGNTIHITDVSKMPRAAKATQKLLESQDIKSLLVIPLYTGGKLVGFAGFDDVAKAGEWNDDDLMLLRICSEIVGKALESKRANDKLKESEKQFRVLAEENPNGIFIYDFKCLVYLNKRITEIMGYTLKECYSRNFNFLDTIAPESKSRIKENILKHSQGKNIEPYEAVFITKGSKRVDTLILTNLIEYKGKPAIFGVLIDVTERKEAEKQIKESEAQFKVLAEENPSMIYIHDFKGIVYANQKAADVMGYTREQGCSKKFDFMKLVAPEFRPDIRKFIIKNMEGKDIEPFECTLITQKGKRLDVIMTTKLIQYRGKPAALGMVTDITERKEAEKQIMESEAKFRILFNTAKDAIFINDKTGRFIDVNKAACESLGYTKDELLKLSNKNIDTEPTGFQEFKKLRDGKIKETKFEMKQRRKDGTYHYVEIMGSSFKSRGQQVFLAIARDIADRKKAEAKIEGYARELETKVKERTKEISAKIEDLERFHNLAVGRELKMIELKEYIKKLEDRLKKV